MNYVTTSKICENGKRTGFVFMNERLQTFLVKDDELEKLAPWNESVKELCSIK